jgi:hypothetical protein
MGFRYIFPVPGTVLEPLILGLRVELSTNALQTQVYANLRLSHKHLARARVSKRDKHASLL